MEQIILIEDVQHIDKERKRKLINYLDNNHIAWCMPTIKINWRGNKSIPIL